MTIPQKLQFQGTHKKVVPKKLGSRLRSPLLPNIYKNGKIPVVLEFEVPLTLKDLIEFERIGITFRRVGSIILHNGGIYTARIPYALLEESSFLNRVERIEYAGRRLHPQLDDSVPHINASRAWTLLRDNIPLTGQGIVIGIIDTGIDWKHPDFYFADGPAVNVKWGSDDGWFFADLNEDGGFQSSEDLEVLDEPFDGWDTTYNHRVDWLFQDKNSNNRYEFGSEMIFLLQDLDANDTISEGDRVIPLKSCKIQQIWDQTDNDRLYIHEVNLTNPYVNHVTDPDQHGTHVTGILGGGQLGFTRRFVGVAPKAEVLVVKTDYEEANVIAGIQWLVQEGADVILMSLGGTTGYFLDGSSLLERTVDQAGVPVVISAGNEGSFDRHAYTFLRSGLGTRRILRVDVLPSTDGTLSTVYLSVLWQNPDNPLRIYLQSPSSSMVELSGKDGTKRVGKNSVSYERSESDRGTMLFDIEITRAGTVETGMWKLTVENQRDFAQVIHCWVETEAVSPTKFLDFATDQFTITNPATADTAIAVVSYNHTTGDLSYFSSQGPRIDGAQKPWVVAPGEAVTSPSAGMMAHSDLTGVSAAAPHVAGVIALMLQADPDASRRDIQERLAQGALKDVVTEELEPTPNALWGFGKLDALRSVLLPVPTISEVKLGEVSLLNASQAIVEPGDYPVTFTIADRTLFFPNTTVQMEVVEVAGNLTSPVRVANLTYQETTHNWWGFLSCQVNTTYILKLTVRDPLLHSTFTANLTVVEKPPEPLTTPETTTPLTPLTPKLPEFVVFPFGDLQKLVSSKKWNFWLVFGVSALSIATRLPLVWKRRTGKGGKEGIG